MYLSWVSSDTDSGGGKASAQIWKLQTGVIAYTIVDMVKGRIGIGTDVLTAGR